MSNDCSRFPAFVSLSSPPQGFLLIGLPVRGFLTTTSLEDMTPLAEEYCANFCTAKKKKSSKKKNSKGKTFLFLLYLFNVSIGLCNLSVASWKFSVLQEPVFARRRYLWNYKFTTLTQSVCTSCDDLPHCECMTKNILEI